MGRSAGKTEVPGEFCREIGEARDLGPPSGECQEKGVVVITIPEAMMVHLRGRGSLKGERDKEEAIALEFQNPSLIGEAHSSETGKSQCRQHGTQVSLGSAEGQQQSLHG